MTCANRSPIENTEETGHTEETVKKSKIKRLVPKKVMREFLMTGARTAEDIGVFVRREAGGAIGRMKAKGYELLTCLETGEGVFARDDEVVGLHIQLPSALYDRLNKACARTGRTKRAIVVAALEAHLDGERSPGPGPAVGSAAAGGALATGGSGGDDIDAGGDAPSDPEVGPVGGDLSGHGIPRQGRR